MSDSIELTLTECPVLIEQTNHAVTVALWPFYNGPHAERLLEGSQQSGSNNAVDSVIKPNSCEFAALQLSATQNSAAGSPVSRTVACTNL